MPIRKTLIAFLLVTSITVAEPPPGKLDLYLLIGQSNMAGRGKVDAESKKPHPRVFMLNKKGEWVPATDPLHFDKSVAGVGPGLAFGKAMADADATKAIGLIPCAAGGSPLDVWKKGGYWRQTKSKPYEDALRRVEIAKKYGTLKGILWHQGESDSREGKSETYGKRLAEMFGRLRKDLGSKDVPILVGGMSDPFMKRNPHAKTVNAALLKLPSTIMNSGYVSAEKLTLKSDNIHFDTKSERELDRRYAKALQQIQKTK